MKRRPRPTPDSAYRRPLGTTARRVLHLLCDGRRTVADLARDLGVTDNAVRAQLDGLCRQGLTKPSGARPGVRRPHAEYELTPGARELLPKAYEPVLRHLVDVLAERLPAGERDGVLAETARRVLDHRLGRSSRGRDHRERVADAIEALGGSATSLVAVAQTDGTTVLRACGCPVASVTAAHPELCALLARALGEVVGADVRERCVRGDAPQCRFEVRPRAADGGA